MEGAGQGFRERGPHAFPEGLRVTDRPWAVVAPFPAGATGCCRGPGRWRRVS